MLTLPVGPAESGPMFYAGSRLAVTTFGCMTWQGDCTGIPTRSGNLLSLKACSTDQSEQTTVVPPVGSTPLVSTTPPATSVGSCSSTCTGCANCQPVAEEAAHAEVDDNIHDWKLDDKSLPANARWIIVLTRVMERSASFTRAVLEKIISMLDLSSSTDLAAWCDCATNFRSRKVLGTLGDMLQWIRRHIHVFYGPPAHFKTIVDGIFGELREIKNEAANTIDISEISELRAVYVDEWARRRSVDPSRPPCDVLEWFPEEHKHEYKIYQVQSSDMPAPLTGCNRWTLAVEDVRRLRGRGHVITKQNRLTGAWLRANKYENGRVSIAAENHPWLLDVTPAAAEPTPAPAAATCASAVAITSGATTAVESGTVEARE